MDRRVRFRFSRSRLLPCSRKDCTDWQNRKPRAHLSACPALRLGHALAIRQEGPAQFFGSPRRPVRGRPDPRGLRPGIPLAPRLNLPPSSSVRPKRLRRPYPLLGGSPQPHAEQKSCLTGLCLTGLCRRHSANRSPIATLPERGQVHRDVLRPCPVVDKSVQVALRPDAVLSPAKRRRQPECPFGLRQALLNK